MLDEEQEAPADDAADAGGDDAVDLADLGGEVETADEPAVSPEELMEIPDAPETPGPEELTQARAAEASDLGAQAAAEDTTGDDAADAGDDADAGEDAGGEES